MQLRSLGTFLLLVVIAGCTKSEPPAYVSSAEGSDVLLLGTFHFSARKEANNDPLEDIFSERRQSEIAGVVEAIAEFRPTKICVEWPVDQQAEVDARFAKYLQHDWQLEQNELYQIGFRLARQLGLSTVHCIDSPMKLPFKKLQAAATKYNQIPLLTAAATEAPIPFEQRYHQQSLLELLRDANNQDAIDRNHRFYMDQASRIGAGRDYAGNDFVLNWYARNLKMFTNVDRLGNDNERVLVLVGAGHLRTLQHFFDSSSHYRLVETDNFLTTSPNQLASTKSRR